MDDELDVLLDGVLDDLSLAGEGFLLAVAAAYRPDDPEHLEAWGDVQRVVDEADAEALIEQIRARVGAWSARGEVVAGGHLGAGPAAEQVHGARMAVGRALVDYLVAYLLRDQLRPESFRALVAPWGLDEDEEPAPA